MHPSRASLSLLVLALVASNSPFEAAGQQHKPPKQQRETEPTTAAKNNDNNALAIDELLKDTLSLLDTLDSKVSSAQNKTPSALMRDKLRSLAAGLPPVRPPMQVASSEWVPPVSEFDGRRIDDESAGLEAALSRLANEFSPQRSAAIDAQSAPVGATGGDLLMAASAPGFGVEQPSHLGGSSSSGGGGGDDLGGFSGAGKRPRNLAETSEPERDSYLANDSTERHIKFTLDLMQSIFASQGYSAKSNMIESFLISPLSIQMVLMMMHLAARGQTRRELGNCLHLLSSDGKQGLPMVALTEAGEQSPSNKPKRDPFTAHLAAPSLKHHATAGRRHQSSAPPTLNQIREQQQQEHQQPLWASSAHELFGASMRNLLKDPIVMKALTSANQIFLQQNLPLSAQYESAIKQYYAANVKRVDFQQQTGNTSNSTESDGGSKSEAQPQNVQKLINDWVEHHSKGRITNFLSSPISRSTLMMAINVLYFRGDWQYKFDPSDTEQEAVFTQTDGKTTKIPMMVNRLPLAFAHDPVMKTSVIELPYKAQRLGLFLLLPDEVSGIFQTIRMLNSTSFAHLIASMRKPSPGADATANAINVRIPKFSIESSPRLSQILTQQLGLKTLFTPDIADLSGMFETQNSKRVTEGASQNVTNSSHQQVSIPQQIGLDELLHKTILQVDEQGSVAAASSAAIVERVGLFNSNYFEADHPFLLFLMDKQTGLVLFSGVFAGNQQQSSSADNSTSLDAAQTQHQAHPFLSQIPPTQQQSKQQASSQQQQQSRHQNNNKSNTRAR